MPHKVAFNTANCVARETGWRFDLKDWGQQDALTRERTDERVWEAICRDIADAGYRAVEVWVAHVDPPRMTAERGNVFRRILEEHGLEPIGLAGALTEDSARVCRMLGIPCCNGGYWGTTFEDTRRVLRETGIGFNYENHPEKSVREIRAAVDGGIDGIGVAVDTGWLGTQGFHVPTAIRALGSLVRHVHVKDVKTQGGHETCPLGEGVCDLPETFGALAEIGYEGWYSWEDEPEDRNPFDIARTMRERIESWIEEAAR